MIKTLCDLLDSARNLLDDKPDPVESVSDNLSLLEDASESQDESNLLWSTDELTTYANEAAMEVAIRARCIRDSSSVEGLTSFAVSDGSWFPVDQRILRIIRVTWNDKRIYPESKSKLDASQSDWETLTGEPSVFVFDQAERLIRPYPTPLAAGVLKISVVRLPVTQMVANSDEPEIPLHMRNYMPYWILHRAYLKNDADTKDDQLAEKYLGLFNSIYGQRPTHQATEFVARSAAVTPRSNQHWY